jgi:hypothetical protein
MSLTLLVDDAGVAAWNPSDAFFWMKRAPMFEVMMMIVFLKLTRFPGHPSGAVLEHLQQDVEDVGCAFSTSSSSTTE